MKSIDIANLLVVEAAGKMALTNLKLNKLVYFCQVECLRECGEALFTDDMEAWRCGPVSRSVYEAFNSYGKRPISEPFGVAPSNPVAKRIVSRVLSSYGNLSTFDFVTLSHREGGAWKDVYSPGTDNPITATDILRSKDMDGVPCERDTAAGIVSAIFASIPNALRLLANS